MDLNQAITDTPGGLTGLFEALRPIYPDAELKDHAFEAVDDVLAFLKTLEQE